jgi:nitrate reductase gamma subunit
MAGSIGGILFPKFSGIVLDKFTASGNVTAGYGILFGICGTAYLVAFGLNHLLAPRYEQVKLRTASPATKRLVLLLVLVPAAALAIWGLSRYLG